MLGLFDTTAVAAGWFDALLQPPAWFDADALDEGTAAVDLAGAAVASATAEAGLDLGIDLAGEALAAAAATGALDRGIELAGIADASASGSGVLSVETEQEVEPYKPGGGRVIYLDPTRPLAFTRLRRRRDEDVIAMLVA